MKQVLLGLLLFFTTLSSAQLVSGTKLMGNIQTTDIKGNAVDIYADLDAGKSVVLDIFATWCGPCWSFHNSGFLEAMHEELGIDGTNQARIYGIEADASTPLGHLSMQVSGNPSSLGDWTKGVKYSLINSHAFNGLLNIAFFPTLYIIRPDRTIIEMGNFRYNTAVWQKALVPSAAKDVVFSTRLDDKTFCATSVFTQKPKVINMGTSPIAEMEMNFLVNGVSKITKFTKAVGVFEESELSFGTTTINATTNIEIKVESIDGVADVPDAISILKTSILRPLVDEKTVIVKFTTDFYAGEISWKLKDNKGRTLKDVTYKAGPEAEGGGGTDANKEFVYEIPIDNIDINCLTLTITDGYGDGMTAFGSTHSAPGVSLHKKDGTVLKPKFSSDYSYTSSKSIFSAASIVSGLEEQDFVQNLSVYPNPVVDILNVDMKIKDGIDYEVFISNVMGSTVTKVGKNTNFIDVSALSSGMYFLNVKTNRGVFAHKFTKI